jgi:hypothetical protein
MEWFWRVEEITLYQKITCFLHVKPWSSDCDWEARVYMRFSSTLMSQSNENKSCMRVNEGGVARVCMRVFSTLVSRSNENKSCMRVDESWEARVCVRVFSTLMARSNENKSCMRVEKREFAWDFSQLSCPSQTRTRVAWELRSESLHEIFLNSRGPVKREQELHESWEARVCVRVFSTLMPRGAGATGATAPVAQTVRGRHGGNMLPFELDKPGQKFHHSLKEHHKISNIPKLRCEIL